VDVKQYFVLQLLPTDVYTDGVRSSADQNSQYATRRSTSRQEQLPLPAPHLVSTTTFTVLAYCSELLY